jgi:hypothetical protein
MDPRGKFAAETVQKLRQALDEVEPYQATELSKQQAIRALSPQIEALRAKGYSWAAVASMLSEHGVPVSVAALRTYLRRVRDEAVSEAPRTAVKRVREGRNTRQPEAPPPPTVLAPSQGRETPPAGKPQQGAAPTLAATGQRASVPMPGTRT